MISIPRGRWNPTRPNGRAPAVRLAAVALAILVGSVAQAQELAFVRIGDPGNPGDPRVMNDGTSGWGSVPYEFEMGAAEVTNLQYLEFLNSVATTSDPHGLWDPGMCPASNPDRCTIRRQSSTFPTSYIIQTSSGAQPKPVTFVDIYDAMRFANWLHNNRKGGGDFYLQGRASTEDGAYTIVPGAPLSPIPKRNPGARYFVPNEDEWYKAAYYDPAGERYFLYPNGSDAEPTCAPSGPNCGNVANGPVQFGGSASPYGTSAQGGNVSEWTERQNEFEYVTLRGGSFAEPLEFLRASYNDAGASPSPYMASNLTGFRVARAVAPTPKTGAAFFGVGSLGDVSSSALEGVSGDGSVAVGFNRFRSPDAENYDLESYEAAAWTSADGLVGLGESAPQQPNNFYPTHLARDASVDGSVVVGSRPESVQGSYSFGADAFRWTESEGFQSLGAQDLNVTGNSACDENWATGVSADGSAVVGGVGSFYWGCAQAFRWSAAEGAVALEFGTSTLPEAPYLSAASGVSADGTVIVGTLSSYGTSEAFRWTEDTGMVGLGVLPGGLFESWTEGVSADGSTVVGRSSSWGDYGTFEAFRWTVESGMVGLGLNGAFSSEARAASEDGSVIVGRLSYYVGADAFIWDAERGMRSIREMLEGEYSLDLAGWSLIEATGISDDGRTIVGNGMGPDGRASWVVTLPTPAPPASEAVCQDGLDNDGDGAVDFPADPDCSSASDTTENPRIRRCGLFGFEIVLVPAFGWVARRLRRSSR